MKKYDKEMFLQASSNDFEEFFDQIERNLEQIKIIIDAELRAYDHNSGLYRTVLWSTRKKEPRRITEKLHRIQKFNNKHNSYHKLDKLIEQHGEETFELRDLLHDLVGARVVVYFSEQLKYTLRYVLTWPLFNVERIIAYEDVERKWIPSSVRSMLDGISSKHGHNLVIEKQANNSSYESIHIHLSINPSFSRRIQDYLNKKRVKIKELSKYTIEIQIRTLLQHSWAQTEHNLNYSLKKKITEEANNESSVPSIKLNYNEILKEDFAQLKANLRTAESMQNLIWNRYVRNHQAINSENDSIDFGDRLSVFKDVAERNKVQETHERLLKAVTSAEDMRIALRDLKSLASEISEVYGGPRILSSEKPDDIYNWARQRAFLLALAYAAIRSNADSGIVINEFYHNNLYDLISSNVLDNTARLYAYIRLWDNEKKHELNDVNEQKDSLLLIDPVVSYRQAFVEYSANNPKYALSLIDNSIEERKKLIEGNRSDRSSSLNLKHLYRRRAQCYWAMYFLFADGTDDNLDAAEYEYEKAFEEYQDAPSKPEKRQLENIKLGGLYGALLFHRYIYGGKWTQFNPKIFMKQIHKYIEEHIQIMEEFINNNKDKRGFITHVIALYYWSTGKSEKINRESLLQTFEPELDHEWSILADIKFIIGKYDSLEHYDLSGDGEL